ncbi:phosphate/phosphite/phosphonate ABC transporter substrate-binding protein [Dechloromonas sp.]|uniref:phosphate/phosphite/phosphonate ABC transporter substrate-binding protein n=1 Tax=Dechloromonas sp. TaxID=1917218 RepID=UPI0011F80E3B|nr:phosphate/phosphite/phosphonate ABC transporter substrate-binding protein [Dechloromonas sp.]MBU3697698.1 phosphate/phosphite/phosphonate ABC transporter substrate-binding protein [Dechloromonas sp.]TEX44770.1 MAG: hypothetical protein CFR70_12660 [Rhodocyclaceae bacterium]
MRFSPGMVWALLCTLLTAALPTYANDSERNLRPLTLGIVPYLSTRNLLAIHQPLARRLETSLQQPVQIQTAPDFDTFVKRLVSGDFDLAIAPPHYARLAIREYGYQALLVHKAPIRGILVTARQQPLASADDLRGKAIAIADRSALLVILGAAALADLGLREEKDYRFVEAPSHASALHSAVSGKAAAALVTQTALLLAPAELQRDALAWRELAQIPGQFYVAHNRLSDARQKAIKAALLAFERSAEGQTFFDKTRNEGFREPTSADNSQLDRALPETRRLLGPVLR